MALLRIIILFIIFIASQSARVIAQPFLERSQEMVVTIESKPLNLPWIGGLNNPQFSSFDFNSDGISDLFLFDKSGEMRLPLVSNPSSSDYNFTYAPEYAEAFPELKEWVLLRDYNCDGKADIFTSSLYGPGAMVYLNNGQTGNDWFSIADSLLLYDYDFGSVSGTTNLFISKVDVPAILDYDGDGDLDIFTYQVNGFQLEYAKNRSVELTGACGLDFELKNRCWGYFKENVAEGVFELGQNCSNVSDPERGPPRHTGSSLLIIELSGDTFPDLLVGDISYNRLSAIINGGLSQTEELDSLVEIIYHYPENEPADLNIFPAVYSIDINRDGLNDLVVAPNAPFVSDNLAALKLYYNQGDEKNPDFVLQPGAFIQDQMIDVGAGAYPQIMDVDADGLEDLLVGNLFSISNEVQKSGITFFKNTGTSSTPSFELITRDWQDFSRDTLGDLKAFDFMDLNRDGALDILIGNAGGTLNYYLNQADADQPFDFSGSHDLLKDEDQEIIDVGRMAVPTVFDLNQDGFSDLIIGNRKGTLVYYENTAETNFSNFIWRSDSLGGVKVPGYLPNTGYSTPCFYYDESALKLVVGSETGELSYFGNIRDNLNGFFEVITGPGSDFDEGDQTVPLVYDIDHDGLNDLMIGNFRGGLSYFKGGYISPNPPDDGSQSVLVYPNPTLSQLFVDVLTDDPFKITIYNPVGQAIYKNDDYFEDNALLDLSNWPTGTYIISIEFGSQIHRQKIIKITP